MGGILIDTAKYMDGHSDYGERTINVRLIAFPTNITVVYATDNIPMFSVPWGSFNYVNEGFMEKRGAASVGSLLASTIPVLDMTKAASPYHAGIYLSFSDEEIQRNQKVFFSTGTERKARKVTREIMHHRDNYFRVMRKSSGPTQRE